MSRSNNINVNKKVRVYHHGQHLQFCKRSSILKLQTPQGLAEGHDECAKALESNVYDHLSNPAPLDPNVQEILLKEVKISFTDEDNLKLKTVPTKSEIKTVLDSFRPHAAPGTDGLTVHLNRQCWNILGDPLSEVIQEVFKGAKPSASQRTSLMVFGNKPGKKAKSLLISDRRKLSLLNSDFILMTGIEAARIRATMSRTVSSLQLVTGGEKRISHGVAMARDAIHAAGKSKNRCGILDTDLIAAFCNMVAPWCYQVMYKKGLCEEVISRYRNLYEDNLSIIVVNNLQGKCVKNTRQSIQQGDNFAMELFSFGMDPILGYLEKRLQGILVHSIPVQGPVLLPRPPATPSPAPPPPIPGLPALPPAPPANRPPRQVNHHPVLPSLETRYILYAYCDDPKTCHHKLMGVHPSKEGHDPLRVVLRMQNAQNCSLAKM